jgi:peptide/nickel transport system substrate-binding protein
MSLLSFFTTGALGGSNDSFFTDPEYDDLFAKQQRAVDTAERKGYIARMQEIFYERAPYHVLYYDSELHAYRTDRFGGWTNQPPDSGTPLFGYGPIGYTVLTAASAAPSPGPSAGATPTPSAGGGGTSTGGSDSTLLIALGVAALVVIIGVGLIAMRRRTTVTREEE